MRLSILGFWFLFTQLAYASVDEKCMGLAKPADYNEQAQQDFLSNYVALATTFSPLHGPIPDDAALHREVWLRTRCQWS